MVGHATPSLQQLLIGVDTPLDVRLIGPKEVLQRAGAQLPSLPVVLAAKGVHVVAPEGVDKSPHGLGVFDVFAIGFDVLRQYRGGIGG
jgi:hypothetical protein